MNPLNHPPKPDPEPYVSELEKRLRAMYARMKREAEMEGCDE